MLEPDALKGARPVLRGGGAGDSTSLPDRRGTMCTIRIGGEEFEFLAISILGRSHPDAGDYWDGNWVRASVEVAAGGFRGEVAGDLAEELASFHREVARLAGSLAGEARLATMEEWLSIVVDRRRPRPYRAVV